MITKYQRRTIAFIRKYLSTVVTIGVLLALVVVTVCSLSVSSEGTQYPETSSGTESIYYNEHEADVTRVVIEDNNSLSSNVDNNMKPETVSKVEESEVPEYYIDLTDDEIYMLATLIYLEGNTESAECQKAICSVVINRMTLWDMTLEEVIYQKNQFTPARLIKYYDPTDVQIGIVEEIMKHGVTIPEYVCYFRADRYHNWSGMNDFKYIDSTYFSFSDVDYGQYIKECNNEI